MKKLILLLVLTSVLLLTGCATINPPNQYKNERIFNKSFTEMWTKTLNFLISKGFVIQLIEKDSGIILTQEKIFPFNEFGNDNKYVSRPNSIFAVWSEIKMQYQFHVIPIDSLQTKINVRGTYYLYDMNAMKRWIGAQSTGLAEYSILGQLGE